MMSSIVAPSEDGDESLDSAQPLPLCAVNVKMSVKPEKRDAWLTACADNIRHTRNEEGNLQCSISQAVDDPNMFYFHERFVDDAAYHKHRDSPHFAKYSEFENTEQPLNAWPEYCFFTPLGEGEDGSPEQLRTIPETIPAYCVTVNVYPTLEAREEFLRVLAANKAGTEATEPLVLQYTYGESTTEPNTFHFHEEYKGAENGKEGFDAHAATPHFADWEAFAGKNPFVKPPEVIFSIVKPMEEY